VAGKVSETRPLSMKVVSKNSIADGVVGLRLSRVDDQPAPQWAPGSHIDLVLDDGVVRQYSLRGDEKDQSALSVAVQRDLRVEVDPSVYVAMSKPGDVIEIGGPRIRSEGRASRRRPRRFLPPVTDPYNLMS